MTGVMTFSKLKSDSSAVSAASGTSTNTEDDNVHTPPPTNSIHVTVDALTSDNGTGHCKPMSSTKAAPVCVALELKAQSLTTVQLLPWTFSGHENSTADLSTSFDSSHNVNIISDGNSHVNLPACTSYATGDEVTPYPIPKSVSVVASTPSCLGSKSSDCDVITLSDSETKLSDSKNILNEFVDSKKLNARVLQRKESRQGRASQRWVTGNHNTLNDPIRLVTGTVPILKGGKILFVSASRKSEWILPKGGWEGDESMEESAVRESFEEAGVIGVLGKCLSSVQYETRKSKKRRLEMEELKSCLTLKPCERTGDSVLPQPDLVGKDDQTVVMISNNNQTAGLKSADEKSRSNSQNQTSKQTDECMSVGSAYSATYSQVKMILFPLYVTGIMADWPESGRLRTAIEIDEAIKMMDGRPEFKAILMEVKALGLHLIEEPQLIWQNNQTH